MDSSTASLSYVNFDPKSVKVTVDPNDNKKYIMTNATIDLAPFTLQKRYLTGEGKGGVFDEPDYANADKSNPNAKVPRKDLMYPQDSRLKATYGAMLTPRLPETVLQNVNASRNIRRAQYESALKLRLIHECAFRQIFDEELGHFGEEARTYKEGVNPNDAEAMNKAFQEFLGTRTKDPLDPRLYNWDTLGEVELKVPGLRRPYSKTKKYPPTFCMFIDWNVFGAIFVDDGNGKTMMLPRPKKDKDMKTPDYTDCPATPENFAFMATTLREKDNMKMQMLRWFDPKAKNRDPDTNELIRPEHTFTDAAGRVPDVTMPNPFWCPIDFAKELCMITLRATVQVMQSAMRPDTHGSRIDFSRNLVISYRAERPQSEEFTARSRVQPVSTNAELFADIQPPTIDDTDALEGASMATHDDLFNTTATVGTKRQHDEVSSSSSSTSYLGY